jgi:hypothetical protein
MTHLETPKYGKPTPTFASSLFIHFFITQVYTFLKQLPIQWISGVLSVGEKQLGQEVNQSPPSSTKVKNEWSYNSTLPYMPSWCGQGQVHLHSILMSNNLTTKQSICVTLQMHEPQKRFVIVLHPAYIPDCESAFND